ncbi:GNAT family N-acetyltransferase [Halobacillus litoralis]|uniref:GNAT family N-acetyltransferase n=1 Tax=Halobacillus litoralis TaxID=45668 RepID=UPI001CFCD891|nr:GNAT family N-acetyltransferase [Halobacillus litoralis]
MNPSFIKLTTPTNEQIASFNRWNNDPALIPLTRPNKNQEELDRRGEVTLEDLRNHLVNHETYFIYWNHQLVGEMNYMIDPPHLHRKIPGTAWIGITIGEEKGRGKGIGLKAMEYLEGQIKEAGLGRMELGVFEFNETAQRLYQKRGFKPFARLENFTYWKEKMWADIRMEKLL